MLRTMCSREIRYRLFTALMATLGLILLGGVAEADDTVLPEQETEQAADVVPDTDPSALTEHRSALAPYGAWYEDPVYGTVWVPSSTEVGTDFVPYVSSGHWELTASGDWLWVSSYKWGAIPFHYGRWVWAGNLGWAWIPGRVYAPAWVVWQVGEPGYSYVSWAPMPPSYYWVNGIALAFWLHPSPYYVYCHSHYVFSPHWHRHAVHGPRSHGYATRMRHHGRQHGGAYVRGPGMRGAHASSAGRPRTAASPQRSGSSPSTRAPNQAAARPHQVQPQQRSPQSRPAPGFRASTRPSPESRTFRPQPKAEARPTPPQNRIQPPPSRNWTRPQQPTPQPSYRSSPRTPERSWSTARPSQPSVRPSQPSVRPSQPSVRPSQPSVRPQLRTPPRPSTSSRPSFNPGRSVGRSRRSR